jgi:penicillin amidase
VPSIEIKSHPPRWRIDPGSRWRWPLRIFGVLLLVIIGAGIYGWRHLASSLPRLDGDVSVAGLERPVTIVRDTNGVPHITADDDRDAAFGLGFAHAQDRLWQLELQRRIGAGRLSELAGDRTLVVDRQVRTIGFYRAAEAAVAGLDAESRTALEGYAAGVNAFLASHSGALPPEFVALGLRPAPWKPADSLAWLMVMSWGLSTNVEEEIMRARLAARFTPEQIDRLLLNYPEDGPRGAAPQLASLYRDLDWQSVAAFATALPSAPAASNNWVVSGARSASGKPLLANDPHLLIPNPSVWYLAHVRTPAGNVVGASIPGLPGIVVGRNDRIAWGVTNVMADVQDLYIERLVDGTGDRYLTPEGPRAFEVRREKIAVRGGADVELVVRSTRHGPVVSDVREDAAAAAPHRHVVALAWAPLHAGDTTVGGFMRINRATNAEEFAAGARLLSTIYLNLVYADVDGTIAYYASGRFPRRKPENTIRGSAPNPGWLAAHDWDGWVPFEELPRTVNPPTGALATANHRIVPDGYPHHLSATWMPGFRIRRINQLLAATPSHSPATFTAMQADQLSLQAAELLPLVLRASSGDGATRAMLERMGKWNRVMDRDRPEPLVWAAWYRHLLREVLKDDLGDLFDPYVKPMTFGLRFNTMQRIFAADSDWCDDVRTRDRETCEAVAGRALTAALAELRAEYGSDVESWRWGAAHPAWFKHEPFSRIAVLGRFFDRQIANGGDAETVNVATYLPMESEAANRYRQVHGPGLRMIVDLANPEEAMFVTAPGQSGNPMSPHYDDMLQAWRDVRFVTIPTDRGKLVAARTLNLVPTR